MGFVRISGAMRQMVSVWLVVQFTDVGAPAKHTIHLAPDVHHFLIVRRIFFDAKTHDAIE
jgi:hypothetical protein